MQRHNLQWKRASLIILVSLLFVSMGTNKLLAQSTCEPFYPYFYAYTPSNHKLCFRIYDEVNHYVQIEYPSTSETDPYNTPCVDEPTGQLILPETVTYNGQTYILKTIDHHAFNNCSGLIGDLVIPNTVEKIGNDAFTSCGFTGTLTLGSSLKEIGKRAFYDCQFSGSLVLPNTLQVIGECAFQQQSSHNAFYNGELILSNSLVTIGNLAFLNCRFSGPLVIPNSVTSIGTNAFGGCNRFTGDLILPNSLTSISKMAFQNCSGFNGDLVIPKNVKTINQVAFQGCTGIKRIYIYRETPATAVLYNSTQSPFSGMNSNIPVYVPSCSASDYSEAQGWNYFSNYQGCNFFIYDGAWSNQNNWICGIPTEGQHAVIGASCEMDASAATIASLTIFKNKTLSIQPDAALTVTGTITNKGNDVASLVIEDGGQLMHSQNNLLATVKKSINAYNSNLNGWYLISSPLAGNVNVSSVENLLSNSNTYDLYYYNEPTHLWINQKLPENNFTELASGKGYLYANSGDVTLTFAGALKNGSATTTISSLNYQSDVLKGFNLIGNPYAHNVTAINSTNVAPTYYRMNDEATDLMVTEISNNAPLKPAEGLFVMATASNASVTFNPNSRSMTEKTGSICLDLLVDGKISDRLLVKRDEGSDFQKFSINDKRTKLYATKDKEELSVIVANEDEQAVCFKTIKNGTYTISVTLKDVEADYLHLIDNLTGNNIDLLATPTYTFDARVTDYASRFRLIFSPYAIDNGSNEVFAFIANGEFIIANEGKAILQVVDMTGRILSSETINGSFNKPINMSKGVYMLRLINDNDVKTQKIVVE